MHALVAHCLGLGGEGTVRKRRENSLAGNKTGKLACSTKSRVLARDFGRRARHPFAWQAHEVLHLCKILILGGLLRSVLTPVAC